MSEENQPGCLIVGEGVSLNGTFTVPDSVRISGALEGELTAREILVSSTGILKGKITADVIDVRGEIHQELTANKSLMIRSSGKVVGQLNYVELEIEKGGDIEGTLNKLESSAYKYGG
jgi:cytoskeletal protein CcmA (bactofilin family)